jgi:hypothetical protein
MATKVDICNLALAGLGDPAGITSISPPDNSVQANYCAIFYPIALNSLLDNGPWSFSTRRVLLASRTNESLEWLYAFSVPSDMFSISKLLSDRIGPINEYTVEIAIDNTKILYCNEQIVELTYTSSNVSEAFFPPMFVDALITVLRYYLAGPIIKGDVGAAASRSLIDPMRLSIAAAKASDGQNTKSQVQYISPAVAAHTGSGLTTIAGGNVVYHPSGFQVL